MVPANFPASLGIIDRGLMGPFKRMTAPRRKTRHGLPARFLDCHSPNHLRKRDGSMSSRKHTFSKANGPLPGSPKSHSRASSKSRLRRRLVASKLAWKICRASSKSAKASLLSGSVSALPRLRGKSWAGRMLWFSRKIASFNWSIFKPRNSFESTNFALSSPPPFHNSGAKSLVTMCAAKHCTGVFAGDCFETCATTARAFP